MPNDDHVYQRLEALAASRHSHAADSPYRLQNRDWAQCVSEARAASKVAEGWDGRILICQTMPEDVQPLLEQLDSLPGQPAASR